MESSDFVLIRVFGVRVIFVDPSLLETQKLIHEKYTNSEHTKQHQDRACGQSWLWAKSDCKLTTGLQLLRRSRMFIVVARHNQSRSSGA
jgi:hypothetical protein